MSFPYYTFPYTGEAALDSLDFGVCGPVMCCDGVLAVQNQQNRGLSLGAIGPLKRIWQPGWDIIKEAIGSKSCFGATVDWWNEIPDVALSVAAQGGAGQPPSGGTVSHGVRRGAFN